MIHFFSFSIRQATEGLWRNRVMSLAATVTMVLMLVLLSSLVIVLAGMQAAIEGHLPGRTVGDPLQMPGTFVIGRDGRVRRAYYSKTVADQPDVRDLLAAL